MTVFDVFKTRPDVNQIATIVESVYNGEFNFVAAVKPSFYNFYYNILCIVARPLSRPAGLQKNIAAFWLTEPCCKQ